VIMADKVEKIMKDMVGNVVDESSPMKNTSVANVVNENGNGRTKRVNSSPGELPSGGLLEEMKRIKAEREKQKGKEKLDPVEITIVVETIDGDEIYSNRKIVCDANDSVGSLVEKYLDACGVGGSTGRYSVRNGEGTLLDMGTSLAVAKVGNGDTVYVAERNFINGKDMTSSCNPWHLASLVFVLLSVLTCIGAVVAWCLYSSPIDRYLVLMDAGSVHTSVYTYRYSYTEPGEAVEVTETNFCELGHVGISSFKSDPMSAAQFIASNDCVLSSISSVPATSTHVSSILLGSTAGMRVLSLATPKTANQILGNLTRELENISRGMKTEVRILSGVEEAVDGWVTSNYLSGGLEYESEQSGALDWGGASSQITRVAEDNKDVTKNVTLYGKNYKLMARSNICYGQAEALSRHKAILVYMYYKLHGNVTEKAEIVDPCLPSGTLTRPVRLAQLYSSPCTAMVDEIFMEKVMESDVSVTFYSDNSTSGHNQTLCSTLVVDQFSSEVCQSMFAPHPDPTETTCMEPAIFPQPGHIKYLAFSTYWYLTQGLELPSSFSMSEFNERTSTICNLTSSSPVLAQLGRVAEMACFQATFMYHLLTTGYHFSEDTWPRIRFVKRVAEAEVGWSLGHAIIDANELNVAPARFISLPVFVVLLSVSGAFLLLGLITAYQGRRVRGLYSRLEEAAI